MSNVITTWVYGYQGNPNYATSLGVQVSFPVDNINIREIPPQVYQGVSCPTVIEVISVHPPTPTYFCSDDATTLIANANIDTGGTVTSVGLTMPPAFNVANSPITTSGTIAVTAGGLVSQYVRGDGTLADFPGSTGGGSSVSYYLNGSISQGTFGGTTYYQMSRTPITGAGTNFSIAANGYIASFITDPNDPSLISIPSGSWNIQFYLNANLSGGTPNFYVELYTYNGVSFTLISTNSATPESITGGTSVDLYYTSISVPTTAISVTDRLAVRVYVNNSGRTINLYTEGVNLAEITTTFTTGLTAINGLTAQVQYLTTGIAGSDFNISSSLATHTFNLPIASAIDTGKLSNTDWSTFNSKVPPTRNLTINGSTQNLSADRTWVVGNATIINSVSVNTAVASAAYTDYVYLASGTINLTMPTAVGNTARYTIKNVGVGVVTINTVLSQTIDGSSTAPLTIQYTSLDLVSDGSNWNII